MVFPRPKVLVAGLVLIAGVAGSSLWWAEPSANRNPVIAAVETQVAAPVASEPDKKATPAEALTAERPAPPRRKSAEVRPPASDRPPVELAAEWRALRRDLRWQEPKPEKELEEFADWTRRYVAAPGPQRSALLQEGIRLAEARRNVMEQLIETDPMRALDSAVPVVIRREMPQEVDELLEKDVKGRTDLMVVGAIPAADRKMTEKPIRRTATIGGKDYEVFVGPRRDGQPSRARIPLHGIALNGKMAASDFPGRAVEPVEVADAKLALGTDQDCPTSGEETTSRGDEAVMEVAGEYRFYCGASHAMAELQTLAEEESDLPIGHGFVPEGRPYTEGTKTLLIYRVDFPDFPGQVVDDGTLSLMVSDNKAFWETMSYGKTSWALVGQGSTITPTIRLPNPAASYADFRTMINAVRVAALNRGYNHSNYDFDMVVTGSQPDVGFGGVAYVGARGCWLAHSYWNIGVSTHELGHNFGLNHANSWDTADGTTIGAGSSTEYGDPYDTMGVAPFEVSRHYHAQYKNYLDWLPNTDVQTVTASGTYRVFAHDVKAATGFRGIKIPRASSVTGQQNYWVTARDLFPTNRWLASGVFLHWTGNGNERANLLDTTPGSSNGKNDAALVMGRTFSDTALGIHITPIAKGGTTPADSFDVVVNIGAFSNNRRPTLSVSANTTTTSPGQTVTFTATAADLDSDSLAYYWEFGDGTFGTNSPTATKSWPSASEQLVRCTVTDMKGGSASSSVIVRVGNPSTFSIIGKVSDDVGGVEGVTVRAGSRSTLTNSDGTYALVGLTGGSYTLTATAPNRVYLPVGFANPVAVGPSKGGINFGTAPATPKISPLPPLTVNLNTAIGPIPFTVADQDTPLNALTFSASSNNVTLIAAKDVSFGGSGANRTISVTPGTNQTGTATLKVIASDVEGNSSSQDWIITINAPPAVAFSSPIRGDEDTVFSIDARLLMSDAVTPSGDLLYAVSGAVNGTVRLHPDLFTVEFVPNVDFNGAASFQLSATDQSSEPRLFLYYSFEGPDTLGDGKASDRSNFGRDGQFEAIGGGELTYADGNVPTAHTTYHKTALQLVENGDGSAARLMRTIATTELNFSTSPWTFGAWFQRQGDDGDDIIFHVGDGDGAGTTNQIQIVCPTDASTVAVQQITTGGVVRTISAPYSNAVAWHHVALKFTPLTGGTGLLELYLDGVKAGETDALAPGLSQSVPVVFGGHSRTDSRTGSWFNGKLDDISIWSAALSGAEIQRLASMIVPHFCGVTRTAQVNLTVTSRNDAPVIAAITDQEVEEDNLHSFRFSVADDSTPVTSLVPRVETSNPGLIPVSRITFDGSGANRTLTLTPTPNASGSAVLTIIVSDGTLETRRDVAVTVQPVNDAPRLSPIADVTIGEDGAAALLPFDLIDPDSPLAEMALSAESSNEALVPGSALVIAGTGTRRTISVAPAANAFGNVTITVTANDGSSSASTTFNVTIRANADAPTISAISNQTTGIGQSLGPIPFTIGDAETAATVLTLSVKSSNTKLLPATGLVLGGTAEARTLTLNPAAAQAGVATITLMVSDGTSKTARTFNVVVEGEGNLRVLVEGQGTVSPGFLGKSPRLLGQSYTIQAKPKAGYVFDGWTGGMVSSNASLTFVMPEEFELTANFVPSPFAGLQGSWSGLITDAPATHAGIGLVTVKVNPKGSFTGKIVRGGVSSSLKGNLRNDGSAGPIEVQPKSGAPFTVNLQFGGVAGEQRLSGDVTQGSTSSLVSGNRALFTAKKKAALPFRSVPAAWLGKHTIAIDPSAALITDRVGSGFAALTVLPTGVVRAAGKLADGTPFSYSNFLSITGEWPMYLSLYKGAGSLSGWVNWELKTDTDLDGTVRWFKSKTTPLSPAVAGWDGEKEVTVNGSRYDQPRAATKNIPAVPALPFLEQPGSDGVLMSEISMPNNQMLQHRFSLTMDGKFLPLTSSGVPPLSMSLVKGTGLLKGSFVDPASGKRSVGGVLLQRSNRGAGFHLGGNSTGAFSLSLPN